MSLNFTTPAVEAIRSLRTSEHWPALMTGLADVARDRLHAAVNAPAEQCLQATAYARAVHDLYSVLAAVSQNVNQRQVPKLGAKGVD